ncbi:hypothetical protein [Bacillus sp. 123MFChir2]|nr:hypothetical protein [Bacillus sp. 123MFChir2]
MKPLPHDCVSGFYYTNNILSLYNNEEGKVDKKAVFYKTKNKGSGIDA